MGLNLLSDGKEEQARLHISEALKMHDNFDFTDYVIMLKRLLHTYFKDADRENIDRAVMSYLRIIKNTYTNASFQKVVSELIDAIQEKIEMSNRGMSQIEVLTATAILSVLLVPMLFMMMYSNRAVYRSSNDITASTLAISKMEELKSLPYFQLENLLLGLPANNKDRIDRPDAARFIRGPFESYPEKPDISEPPCIKMVLQYFTVILSLIFSE